jgi:hypothetical protein
MLIKLISEVANKYGHSLALLYKQSLFPLSFFVFVCSIPHSNATEEINKRKIYYNKIKKNKNIIKFRFKYDTCPIIIYLTFKLFT